MLLPGNPTARGEDADWPDAIAYPYQPVKTLPDSPTRFRPVSGKAMESPAGVKGISQNAPEAKPGKKSWWPFKGKSAVDRQPPPTESQIVNVGPRENPASPDPLLRLGVAILNDDRVIPGGFYLLHVSEDGGNRQATLSRQNKTLMRLVLHPVNAPDENRKQTGTASPIQKTAPAAAIRPTATALLSPDQKSVTIVLKAGAVRFESDPFPVATNMRRILAH